MKELFRWFVRRDTEASGTLLGGWIGKIEQILAITIGVVSGIWAGIIVFTFLWIIKVIVGYADLKWIKGTAYRNDYIGERAPQTVKLNGKQES